MLTKCPEIIYRYQPMRRDAIDFVRNGRLWFSDPSRFNDPFDFLPDFSRKAKQYVDKNREAAYWSDPSIGGSRLSFLEETQEQRNRLVRELCNRHRSRYFKGLAKNFWVACFSETPNSILMWSHYAAFHTGLCIGIRPERMRIAPESGLRWKVHYKDERVPLEHPKLNEIALRKAKAWKYEKEWRVVMATSDLNCGKRPLSPNQGKRPFALGRFLQLSWDAFDSVRFGALVDPKKRSLLVKALQATERNHIKMIQLHLAADKFALEEEVL